MGEKAEYTFYPVAFTDSGTAVHQCSLPGKHHQLESCPGWQCLWLDTKSTYNKLIGAQPPGKPCSTRVLQWTEAYSTRLTLCFLVFCSHTMPQSQQDRWQESLSALTISCPAVFTHPPFTGAPQALVQHWPSHCLCGVTYSKMSQSWAQRHRTFSDWFTSITHV